MNLPSSIIHVVENLDRGGLERMVIDLSRAQRNAGHSVEVVCVFDRGLLADELQASGVPVHACGKRQGLDIAALRRLRQRLAKGTGGILHTHNAAAHYHAQLATMGMRFQRVLNTRHGMGDHAARSRRERRYRRSMAKTDVVAAVCEAARRHFQSQGVSPRGCLIAVPNGIRVQAFESANPELRAALAVELGLEADARIIGSVGRLTPVKDQALLLRAFVPVLAAEPRAALAVVGDGPLRAELEALASEYGIAARTRFLGDRSDVAKILPGFELFALSSRSEGYSIALLEACASALPIVATRVGGNEEIVHDGITGRLVGAGDEQAFALALKQLLNDPPLAQTMGRRGRAWAYEQASVEAMALRYTQLYGQDCGHAA